MATTFRVHFADGSKRDVDGTHPDAVRDRFSGSPVAVTKVKRLKEKRKEAAR